MGFADEQAKLQANTSNVKIGGDDEDAVPDEDEEKKGGFDFLQWIFGWILDPITAIIKGVIGIVKFVVNAIKFCVNLPWCIKWYIFYMIGTILYLPLALLFMFFGLQKIEKKIWKTKKKFHDLIVCYTGYSIIGYSDEIRDGCFFETIKPRICPNANMPNAGFSDFLEELFKGLFSLSYIGVVTALSFLFFCIWFIYYFVKPIMVKIYAFMIGFIKGSPILTGVIAGLLPSSITDKALKIIYKKENEEIANQGKDNQDPDKQEKVKQEKVKTGNNMNGLNMDIGMFNLF